MDIKQNEEFLLSIIIPTKNRQKYALNAIKQILTIDVSNIQIVIQDNSDTKELYNLISEYSEDCRLKYNYSNTSLSFVDNFNQAMSLADGEYICFIGDDDGILPDIIPITQWANKNNIEAIIPTTNIVYIWPQNIGVLKNSENGYMCISYISDKVYMCNPQKSVKKLMSYGGQKYLTTDMVKLYHGVVKRSCVEKVKNQTGYYFGGLTPDIYAAVSLSLVIDSAVRINYPITVSGICKTSGSADSATGKHTGKLEDAPHFKGHTSYEWANEVPPFYSVETIWADSALHAIKEMNEIKYQSFFNKSALDMYCLTKYPQYKKIIYKHMRQNKIKIIAICLQFFRLKVVDFCKRIIRRLFRRKIDVIKKYGVKDINEALLIVYINLKKIDVNVNKIIRNLEYLKQENKL